MKRTPVSFSFHLTFRLFFIFLMPAFCCFAEEEKKDAAEVTIPMETGFWKTWFYWKPDVFGTATDAKPDNQSKHPFSFPPPENWRQPDFADESWSRDPGPFYSGYGFHQPTSLSVICLRGSFVVAEPDKVEQIALELVFRGGVAVYLNGKEIARKHLPEGELAPDTLAEDYPLEVYCHSDDATKAIRWGWGEPGKHKAHCDQRIRKLENVLIPKESLRKGRNILAVQLHRAATHVDSKKLKSFWEGRWNTVGLLALRLKTTAASGVEFQADRPKGFQFWNANPLATVFDVDYGDTSSTLRPIQIAGTRNGAFSGLVVLGRDQTVNGLSAEIGDFKQKGGGATIPASAAQVRYALPSGGEKGSGERYPGIAGVQRFDVLAETPPTETPVYAKSVRNRKAPVFGAVQPIWITVNVPADATAGEYEGTLTVKAEGLEPTAVPVQLSVGAWTLPPSREYVSHIGLIQSPDSVALQYKVPLWSDEHFRFMEESLKRLGQVGNKTAFIPLMAKCNFGNEESMVRFLKQDDGSYKCDFSIMDRYLDLWEKHVGKPDIVCFYVWDYFAGGGYFGKDSGKARGVEVSVWNPVEQKVEPLETPIYGTPESEAFWQPVFTELHEKMKKRGLSDDNIMIGVAGDSRPNKAVTDLFLKIAPYAQWVLHSHALAGHINGAKVGYYCHVWGVKFAPDPDEVDSHTKKSRYQGWNQTFRKAVFPRAGSGTINPPLHADAPLGTYRLIMEGHLVADYRGFGRVGADFWPVGGGSGERNTGREIIGRYPGTSWSQLNLNCSTTAVLAPGPQGAIATARFEMLREGIQESEARIFIEKALINPEHRQKLGDDKAKELQDLLDLRTRLFRTACQTSWSWYAGTGWVERARQLFAAAADVQTTLNAP